MLLNAEAQPGPEEEAQPLHQHHAVLQLRPAEAPRQEQGSGLGQPGQDAEPKGQPPPPPVRRLLLRPGEAQGGAHQGLHLCHRQLLPVGALPPEQLGDAHSQAVGQGDEQGNVREAQPRFP